MKNTLAVLIVLFSGSSTFAQDNAAGYGLLNSYLQAEKNNHGLLIGKNNAPLDGKRFIKLYNHQHPAAKKAKRVTFMDRPVVFSSTPAMINSPISVYQQKESINSSNPTALELFGFAAGLAAQFKFPEYSLSEQTSAIQAYLQSTYRQDHNK